MATKSKSGGGAAAATTEEEDYDMAAADVAPHKSAGKSGVGKKRKADASPSREKSPARDKKRPGPASTEAPVELPPFSNNKARKTETASDAASASSTVPGDRKDGKDAKAAAVARALTPEEEEREIAEALARANFVNPNDGMRHWKKWYTKMEPWLEWRITYDGMGSRATDAKLVLFDKRDPPKKGYVQPAELLTPVHRSVKPEAAPYGDWKNPSLKDYRKNQNIPIEADYRLQIGVKKYDPLIKNDASETECPDCKDFVDRFLDKQLQLGLQVAVRERSKFKEIVDWEKEWKDDFRADAGQTYEEFLVAKLTKKLKPQIVFIPESKDEKTLGQKMVENRRAQIRAPVCKPIFEDGKGQKKKVEAPDFTTDPIIHKVHSQGLDKEGHRMKYMPPRMLDGQGTPLPFADCVIGSGDAVALHLSMDLCFHIKKPTMRLLWHYTGIIYKRQEYKTPEQKLMEGFEGPLPGAQPLNAPTPPPAPRPSAMSGIISSTTTKANGAHTNSYPMTDDDGANPVD